MHNNTKMCIPLHDNGNNENTTVRRKEPFEWTDANTKLFLALYKEKVDLLECRKIKTKKLLWKKISEDMELKGYNINDVQVENKFKSLERQYKNMTFHNRQTGRNKLSLPYET